jgi:hypothetical protein
MMLLGLAMTSPQGRGKNLLLAFWQNEQIPRAKNPNTDNGNLTRREARFVFLPAR